MWTIALGFAALLCVIVFAVWLEKRSDKRAGEAIAKRWAGRPKLSSAEFGAKYYPESPAVAAMTRDILEKKFLGDLSQLKPGDETWNVMCELDSMSDVEFIMDLEKAFGIKIADADAEKMRTFDDVCRYVIAKVDERENANAKQGSAS